MKFIFSFLCLSLLFIGCKPMEDNSANDAFEKNSKTVMAVLDGFQNENLDYDALYSKDVIFANTNVGATKDSLTLDDERAANKANWAFLDFKLLTDPVSLLPGVNADTKMADGSVRLYGNWKVTLTATDSTEARSGTIQVYQSFDFDADGKINFQQSYGDFTGIRNAINGGDDDDDDAEE